MQIPIRLAPSVAEFSYTLRDPAFSRNAKTLLLESSLLFQSTRRQSTISQPATVSGFGFWSGQDVTIDFRPAAENTGIVFVRTDLPGSPRIPAVIQNRVPGPRRTTLVFAGCAVEMVEHVLAALAGLQIDNCEVHVDRAEMPGMDGSSIAFVEVLIEAGRQEQNAPKSVLMVHAPVRVEDGDAWIEAKPVAWIEPEENSIDDVGASPTSTDFYETQLTYKLDYPHAPSIGSQTYSTTLDFESFSQQIAPARTFLLNSEAEQLQRQGLGSRVTLQDVLVFDESGPIDNPLRFPNECARHKTLDMIGDFSLVGKDLIGEFTACKSGHRLNSQMVFALMQQAHNQTTRQSA